MDVGGGDIVSEMSVTDVRLQQIAEKLQAMITLHEFTIAELKRLQEECREIRKEMTEKYRQIEEICLLGVPTTTCA